MTDARPTPDRAGWHEDPDDPELLRYFDGILWTKNTTPRRTVWKAEGQATSESAASSTQSAPGGQAQGGPYGYPPQQSQQQRSPHPQQHQHPQYQHPQYQHQEHATRAAARAAHGGPSTTDGVPLAGMGARFAAWLFDCMITWGIGLVLGGYFLWRGLDVGSLATAAAQQEPGSFAELWQQSNERAQAAQPDMTALAAFALVQLLVGVGYHTIWLRATGATLGKLILGISVRRADRPGQLSWSDAMRRSLLRPVLWMFFWTPIGLFAQAMSVFDGASGVWHPQRKTLHDRIGGTVVVQGRVDRQAATQEQSQGRAH